MLLGLLQLYLLGLLGWLLFKILHMPIPAFLGALTIVGALRSFNFILPEAPNFLSPLMQVFLGFFVGSRVNRETLCRLKEMLLPAIFIVTWTLSIMFLLGVFLQKVTHMDLYTAILSSSIGGIAEMAILAMATDADVAVVTIMQTARLFITLFSYPLIIKFILDKPIVKSKKTYRKRIRSFKIKEKYVDMLSALNESILRYCANKQSLLKLSYKVLPVLIAAFSGGLIFNYLGIPAGAMVGSMFGTAFFSLLFRNVKTPDYKVMRLVQVGIGIMVASNLNPNTMQILFSGKLFKPIIISVSVILISSMLVAYLISKLTGWDFSLCFLAAAPAGFSEMSFLAIELKKDPFKVIMLHLCRVIAVKTLVPFIFLFFHNVF